MLNSKIFLIILGALLGGVISFAGYLFRLRVDRKRVLNKALFDLLNIWFVIQRVVEFDVDYYVQKYKDFIHKQSPEAELPKPIADIFGQALTSRVNEIKKETKQGDRTLQEIYIDSVNAISCYSPVLAFNINKKVSLDDIDSIVDDYFKDITPTFQNLVTEDDLNQISSISSTIKQESNLVILKYLEDDLKYLALRCGLRTRIRVRKKIARSKKSKYKDKFFNEFMEKIMKSVDNQESYD